MAKHHACAPWPRSKATWQDHVSLLCDMAMQHSHMTWSRSKAT